MAAHEPPTSTEADPRRQSRKVGAGAVLIGIGIALSLGTSLFLDGVLAAAFGIGPGMHSAPVAAAAYETVHGVAQASAYALILLGLGLVLWNVRRGPSPSSGGA